MDYKHARNEGWLIGSGVMKSAAKQYKARFTGVGMRWCRTSPERMLSVRSAVLSKNFNKSGVKYIIAHKLKHTQSTLRGHTCNATG